MEEYLKNLFESFNLKEIETNKALMSLLSFMRELETANYPKNVIDDFIFKTLMLIYLKQNNLLDFFNSSEGDAK